MENAQIQLFNKMLQAFNEDELIELAFLLNIQYEDLNGRNRRAKTVSLVDYCKRTERLAELVELCQQQRPTISWPSVADQQADRYDIQEELGSGAFATVYKARDKKLDRTVAIKILHEHLRWDPDNIERFHNEASSASKLNHPGIVTIYDRGEMNGRFYITMAYIDGQTLRQFLENNTPLSLTEAIKILQPIAEALDYAHEQGMVHRDIKPNNIMVQQIGTRLKTTLLDFGLVKAMDGTVDLTSLGVTLGTPEYMSPEQADPARRQEIGPATDRYALGIVAYQMLTGRVPFEGNTSATLYAHEYKPVPLPQELRPELSNDTALALVKMLAKDKADRFESAAAFVQALDTPSQTAGQAPDAPPVISEVSVPGWAWGFAGLVLLAVILVIWRPWAGEMSELDSGIGETAVSQPTDDKTIDLNQTVRGKISGAGTETWTYTGSRAEVDIRVDGGLEDTFVLILAYQDGGQAAYIDYSGKGEGELLKYYDLQENMKIVVDETENDGAEYTLSITPSEWKYLWPGGSYGGEIRGANPEKFLYGDEAARVNIIVEMTNAEQPLLEVYKSDGGLMINTNEADKNGRLILSNLEFEGGGEQYAIIIRDLANNGATYFIEMQASEEAHTPAMEQPGNTQTPPLAETPGFTWTRDTDEMVMVFVPGDTFIMGAAVDDPDAQDNEMPRHDVTLTPFWLDQTEVTNAQFITFLNEMGNQIEEDASWINLDNPSVSIAVDNGRFRTLEGFADHPVVAVSWYGAQAYCQWAGVRLPTEAEWEFAAKGPEGYLYPWGNESPGIRDCSIAHYTGCSGEMTRVGSHPGDYSWVAAADMAGNAQEWVADLYGDYPDAPQTNPTGVERSDWRVQRGGNRTSAYYQLRTTARYHNYPDYHGTVVGFRCAASG